MADSKPLIVVSALRGLDERWDPVSAGNGSISAAIAEDLWYDPRGGFSSAGGYRRIIRGPSNGEGGFTSPFAGRGALESIHWFSQHNGSRRWLIYIDSAGALYEFNPSTAARSASPGDLARDRSGNTITRTVVDNPWQRSQSACWGDVFYMVNGIDRPLTFNGYVWDYAGFSSAAGTVGANAMANPHMTDSGTTDAIKIDNIGLGPTSIVADDDYKFARRYRVSFINDRGAESPLSEPSEIVYFTNTGGERQSDGAHTANVSLPVGDASVVGRRVYCTQNLYDSSSTLVQGRDQQYFYHSDIGDNVAPTFMDVLGDGYLGATVDPNDFGAWPVNAKFIAPFKGRMYAAGAGNSLVYYSRRGSPEVWPVNNVIDVGDGHLGPITAMYATRNALVVSKARGIYLIKDDGVNEPRAETLTKQSGWIAQNTVRELPGIGVVGLSDEGIVLLKGTLQNEGVETQVFNLAVGLPDTFARINRGALQNACAAVYHRDKEYWLCIPTLGYSNNNLVLVFHYEVREWTTRENYPICSILETPDAAGNLLFASYAATSGASPDGIAHLGVFVYTRSAADKDGTAITPVYRSNAVSIVSQYRTFKPLHILVDRIVHGNNKLKLNLYSNYSVEPWFPTALGEVQQTAQEVLPVYGAVGTGNPATFDSGKKWQTLHPGTGRFDVTGADKQPVVSIAVEFTPSGRFMTLSGFDIEIHPNDPIQTKPLLADGTR